MTIAFLFSCVAVSFVVLFTQSFRMLSFVIDNSSTLIVFVQLMGLMLPTFLPLILPISFAVAVLFIYHKLAVDSELVILRSAGISPLHLARPALWLAFALVLLGGTLTIWATPAANRALVSLQYQVRDEFSAFMIQPGVFNDVAKGLTLFAQKRDSSGRLENILVHDVRRPEKPVTIMAKSGLFSVEGSIPQIFVFEGRRQVVDVTTGRLQQLNFDRYALDLNVLTSHKKDRQPNPRELPVTDLFKVHSTAATTLDEARIGRMRSELHQRFASPLLSITFALLCVTVILVGDFNRRGMTRRVIMATIGIIIVQAAMLGLVSQIARSVWYVPILYAVVLTPIPICITLLGRKSITPIKLPLSWLGRFS